MLVMFENRFKNMTKDTMKHFMFEWNALLLLIDKNQLVFEQSNYRLNKKRWCTVLRIFAQVLFLAGNQYIQINFKVCLVAIIQDL